MKKFLSSFFIAVLLVITAARLQFGQTAATATWPLSSDTTVIVTGNVNAMSEYILGLQAAYEIPAAGTTSMVQKLKPDATTSGTGGTGSWPTETAANAGRYIEFAITPQANSNLNINSIEMLIGNKGIDGMNAGIYYSTHSDFSNSVQIAEIDSLFKNGVIDTTLSGLNIAANNGETLYIRIYPWLTTSSTSTSKYFYIGNLVISGNTTVASNPISLGTSQDFESYMPGDSLLKIGWSQSDIQSVIVADPLNSGHGNVLKNTVHNYNAAPVIMFVLPAGKTLADYDSLSFDGYFQKGDVAYKGIVAEAYQTKPTGHFLDTDTLGFYNRAEGVATAWEHFSINISNTKSYNDTIYISLGINCSGLSGSDTTTWYADNLNLVPKPAITGPIFGTSQDFESYMPGDSLLKIGWSQSDIQSVIVADPLNSGHGNVLKNTVHNYNAAPVIKFVLPAGKTLADYDSLSFDGYFQKGDVAYKGIVAEAYQTIPTGHFLDTDTLGLYNRAEGAATAWEHFSINISNTKSYNDTIYIALGINCSGLSGSDTTTWYADNLNLVPKPAITGPIFGTSQNFESYMPGDSLLKIGWSQSDIQSVIVADPLNSGHGNVLENIVHNYNAAPVITFVLPAGKTLADYDSLSFDGYFQKGDVGYKGIVAEAYQTEPTGHFLDTDTLGLYNRVEGAATAWEHFSIDISNTKSYNDTIYIALGINCSGLSGSDTTTWYADNLSLVAKTVTPPPPPPPPPANVQIVTNGDFEDSNVGQVDTTAVKGWLIQVASGVTPAPVFEIVSDTVEHGNRALKVTVHGLGTNQWDIQAVADSIHVKTGVTYTYSIWAKAEKAGAQVNFTVGNYSYSEYGAIRPANLTTQWTKYSMKFTVNDGKTIIRAPIHFGYAADTGNAIYIDNLQIIDSSQTKKPVYVEAESGNLGSNFSVIVDSANHMTYVTAKNNNTAFVPGDSSRVATYQVTFPDSGWYNLFARVRVGPNTFNDDSFFYGHGFGTKNDTASADWVFINGLASAGFTDTAAVVTGAGTVGSQVWKWVNLTQDSAQFPADTFYVSIDSLTRTFQIGTREDGLDIDKLAFGKSNLYFTVNALDNNLPGSTTKTQIKLYGGPPIAQGAAIFLGNVKSAADIDFKNYWDQLTPGNEGKWGSVATTQDTTKWNWAPLDALYNYAEQNKIIFKDHNLIWGQQQPSWISSLDSATQYKYIETWIRMVGQRYPNMDMIDVVNEPLNGHNPPDGQNGRANYENALGGKGTTGWDWVINAFTLARKYIPNAKLLINDYGIINDNSATTNYLQIINLLKDRGLVDGIGVQGHRFELENADTAVLRANLNKLGATGLPIYISELDLGNIGNTGTPSDNVQLGLYKKIFPVLWTNPYVKGITLWGYKEGEMWQATCYLVNADGSWRTAMTWLAQYVKDNPLTGVETASSNIPSRYELDQNYPNPFNPTTNIRYSIIKSSKVTLQVYDILGRLVKTLVNEVQSPGHYTITFNAETLASGIYFYRIQAGSFMDTKKLILLK